MTIRIADFQVGNDARQWLDMDRAKSDVDVTYFPKFRRYMLSMVRHIMRDYACDMVPVVLTAYASETVNEWGHNFYVEVQYAACGWHTIYAARITPDGLTNVTCYAD